MNRKDLIEALQGRKIFLHVDDDADGSYVVQWDYGSETPCSIMRWSFTPNEIFEVLAELQKGS